MRKLLAKFDKFEEVLLVSSLALSVILVFLQVIMRSFFNASLTWSEELSRYLFIWQTWLGVSIAYKYNEHIKVELIYDLFKSKVAHKVIKLVVDLIWLAFNAYLVYLGVQLLGSMASRNALSSGMRLPLVYVYAALPVSSFLVSIRIFFDLIDQFKSSEEKEV
ncbi:TRAP transporters [Peptoniphilus sp. ING2-D1G]|nr:TRAP transporters [Peptoniphilus sp. ING2-D1G]